MFAGLGRGVLGLVDILYTPIVLCACFALWFIIRVEVLYYMDIIHIEY